MRSDATVYNDIFMQHMTNQLSFTFMTPLGLHFILVCTIGSKFSIKTCGPMNKNHTCLVTVTLDTVKGALQMTVETICARIHLFAFFSYVSTTF